MKTSLNHKLPSLASRPRRGFTLIEALVSISMLVVVLGLTLGIVIQTERGSAAVTRRMNMASDCQAIIEALSDAIAGAADPAQFNGSVKPESIKPDFQAGSLTLPTLALGRQSGLCLVTLGTAQDPQGKTRASLAYRNAASGKAAEGGRLLGDEPDHYTLTVGFGYAAASAPGEDPVYREHWDGPGSPALIQIQVTGTPDGGDTPLKLQTAIALDATPAASPVPAESKPETVPAAEAAAAPTAQPAPVPATPPTAASPIPVAAPAASPSPTPGAEAKQ